MKICIISCNFVVVTTHQAFSEADLNHDGRLSYAEFTKWYMASNESAERVRNADDFKKNWNLERIREETGLGEMPVYYVFSVFADGANANGVLDRDAFDRCVLELVRDKTDLNGGAIERMADELFDIFDSDGNGFVDFTELSSGLSVLCGGNRDDKVWAAFNLFDTDRDGYISEDEMTLYLTSVFKLLYATKPELQSSLGVSAAELGRVTAHQAFEDADINHDGAISFEEFKHWYAAGGGLTLDDYQRGLGPDLTLSVVREATGLQDFHVEEVVRRFEDATDRYGRLSRSAFNECFKSFVDCDDPNDERLLRLNVVLTNLFELFDEDNSGFVDNKELISGLTVLCAGERDDKVRVAFSKFDTDGDGFITKDEMCTYLESVFKLLYRTNPESYEHTGVDAKTLAEKTTEKAFEDTDANRDGRLSFEEFTRWYELLQRKSSMAFSFTSDDCSNFIFLHRYTSSPEEGSPTLTSAGSQPMTMKRARWLLNLDKHALNDILDTLVEAGPQGVLSRDQFVMAMLSLMRLGGNLDTRGPEYNEALTLIDRIFAQFTTDSGNEAVLQQLTSGLSILCSVSFDEKVDFAFILYDIDSDGFVSYHGLVEYMTSVFKVLFVTTPSAFT